MNAKEFYENGELYSAITTMNDEIKRNPLDIYKRDFLRDLLCITGQFERADKQLDIIAQQDPRASVGAALIRQLIRAEQRRQQCFNEGGLPEFVHKPTPALLLYLQALIEIRAGDSYKAYEHIQQAEANRLPIYGEYNGQSFQGMRDLDDTCAGYFEVLTSNGKYYWIAPEQVALIEFHKPERPLDLIWRRAHMTVINGPEGEVYFPTIYIHTPLTDEMARLGRKTDWQSNTKPTIGSGQRMYLIGDEVVPIMELQELIMHGIMS